LLLPADDWRVIVALKLRKYAASLLARADYFNAAFIVSFAEAKNSRESLSSASALLPD
jgi:hypothetical protein